MNRIVSEHFSLTPAIKEHVNQQIKELEPHLPQPHGDVQVTVDETSARTFRAVFKIHAWKKEVISKALAPNLYFAISQARLTLARRLDEIRHKRISKFRKQRRMLHHAY